MHSSLRFSLASFIHLVALLVAKWYFYYTFQFVWITFLGVIISTQDINYVHFVCGVRENDLFR